MTMSAAMRKVRAGILAMMTAGTGGFLLWSYLHRFEAEASGGPRIGVLVSVRTLEPGAILREEDIGERMIPQSYVETRAIRLTDRQHITNLRVTAPLQAQQTLMWTDIVLANDDKHDIVGNLQPGMRAVTIHPEGKSGSLVHGGDRVDVIGIFGAPTGSGGNSDARTGVVLLQNVLVLGRNDASDRGGSNSGSSNGDGNGDLALSLPLQKAQILTVAADKGKLAVVARGRGENHQDDVPDFSSTQLMDSAKPRAVAAAPAKAGPVKLDGAR